MKKSQNKLYDKYYFNTDTEWKTHTSHSVILISIGDKSKHFNLIGPLSGLRDFTVCWLK